MYSRAQLQDYARQAARRNGVPEEVFLGLVQQESGWNPGAVSPVGARGLTQIMPDTAASPGFGMAGMSSDALSDPMAQLDFGAEYFSKMLGRSGGDVNKALASYNWGAGNVDKYGLSALPDETADYLRKVRGYADDYAGGETPLANYGIVPGLDVQGYDPRRSGAGVYPRGRYYDAREGVPEDERWKYGARANRDEHESEYVDHGGTPEQTRSVLGSAFSGALRGGLAGGPLGMLTGGLAGLIAGGISAHRAATMTPEQAEAAKAKFGVDDAALAGVQAIAGGNPLSAVGTIAGGLIGNALPDKDPTRYGAMDAVRDVVGGALGGNAIGGAAKAAGRGAGQALEDAAPGDGGLFSGAAADIARGGIGGFAQGGLPGAVGGAVGGLLGNRLESWQERKDAKAAREGIAGARAGLDAATDRAGYRYDPGGEGIDWGQVEAAGDARPPSRDGSSVVGNDSLSDALRDAGL